MDSTKQAIKMPNKPFKNGRLAAGPLVGRYVSI